MNKKIIAYMLAVLSVFFWGITFVSTKILLTDFSALEILFIRFLLAYFGLWIIRPKWEKIRFKDNVWFLLAALSGVVIYQFTENLAINYTTASNVSVIVSICPMFTAIVCQIFLKEKNLTNFFIIGFVISIIGVGLVSLNGKIELSLNPLGDLLALCASVCWGFYSLVISIINKKHYDSICGTRRIFFYAVICMIPLMIAGSFSGKDSSIFVTLNAEINAYRFSKIVNWVNLLFLGLIASGFCFVAWNKACNELGTVKISTGIYMIPVVTIIFAFVVLHEKLSIMGITGSMLTIAGLFISGIKSKNTSFENKSDKDKSDN